VNVSAGLSFCFAHVYSIANPFLSIAFGSMLNVVKSLEKIFLFSLIWMFSNMFPEFIFVIVCVRIRIPDLSSVVVIPFFSPRYKLPSIFFLSSVVWKIDSMIYTPAFVFLSLSSLTFAVNSSFWFGARSNVALVSNRIDENFAERFLRVVASRFLT